MEGSMATMRLAEASLPFELRVVGASEEVACKVLLFSFSFRASFSPLWIACSMSVVVLE